MDALEIERAHLVGNSMGGRVAIEIGPALARARALAGPAVPRGGVRAPRLSSASCGSCAPSWACCRTGSAARWSRASCGTCSRTRPRWTRSLADVAVDEFQRIYGSAAARLAFLAAARNIYLEAPFGRRGFYPRLAELATPALFVWATHDPLIPAAFKRHVAEWLPGAEQIVLESCGHVPQIERPAQTNGLLRRFFAQVDAGCALRDERAAA